VTAAETYANNTVAVVTSGGTTAPAPGTVETWTLSGAVLPAASSGVTQFHVVDVALTSEKILVTNLSGSTATVTRGAEGTTPVAHSAGFTIRQVVTAGAFSAFPQMAFLVPSGDTSGAADTAAIQAALNAVPANGGTVMLSEGIFYINASLNPTVSGTIIAGLGWGTQIRYDGAVVTAGAIKMGDTTTRRCNIRWLRISQTNATAAGTAIEASYFQDSAIEHVLIDGGGPSGVAPLVGISFNAANTYYNVVSDSRINVSGASSIGIRFDSAANSNVVRNCRVIPDNSNATAIGVYVNARAIELDHVDIENAAGTGISLGASGHGCTITAPYLEANGTNLALASGVNAPTVTGGTIENGSTADYSDSGALTPMFFNVRSSTGGEHAYSKALLLNVREPEDTGYIAWNDDPAHCISNTQVTGGTLYLIGIVLRHAATITNLAVAVDTAAVTATANENFLLLYDSGGTLRGQTAAGAIDTATQSSGLLSHAMSAAYAALPGRYWVGAYFNASTQLKLARFTGEGGTIYDPGLSAASYWFCVNGTGLTTTPPPSVTPSSNTHTGAITAWAGVS
jgi:hypothetical protein